MEEERSETVVVDREPEAGRKLRLCHHNGFGRKDLWCMFTGPDGKTTALDYLEKPPTDHELRRIWDGMMGYFNEWHLMWAMLNLVPLGARPGWSVEDYLLRMLSPVLKTSVTKRAAHKILSYAFWEPMENKTKIYRALSSLNLPKAPMHKLKKLARGRAGQDGAVEFSAFVEWVESQQRPLRPSSSPELILDAGLKLG